MDGVDRDDALAAGLIATTVLLLGAVAATIDDVVGGRSDVSLDVDPQSGGVSQPNGSLANGSFGAQGLGGQGGSIDLVICIDALTTAPAILGIVAGVGLVLYGVYRRYNAATTLLTGTGVVPLVWGLYFFLTNCLGTGTGGPMRLGGSSVVSSDGGLGAPVLPPAILAGLFGVVVIAGLVVLATTIRGSGESTGADVEPDEPATADVARTAGQAADRIETANVPADNAVYRAWYEMTELLDVESPETTVPEDFAGAAIGIGLDRDHVEELTELFRDVRYGGERPDRREDRAVEVLRRIERSYRTTTEEPE